VASFSANADVVKVAQGMIRMVEVLESFSKAEKYAIVSAVFNCMYNNKFHGRRTVTDLMESADNMRSECTRLKIPEFGGAEKFIKGEL
jgi:hypothetical protein|tara:strand:+ start:156 stop:419 length:264 start_codon:yes stop_codon:yes gene_type:complete